MISSELEELTRGCDRVVILREGRSIIEIEGSNISEQRIAEAIASEDIP
jgi:ribose transport system ATP-binding protein